MNAIIKAIDLEIQVMLQCCDQLNLVIYKDIRNLLRNYVIRGYLISIKCEDGEKILFPRDIWKFYVCPDEDCETQYEADCSSLFMKKIRTYMIRNYDRNKNNVIVKTTWDKEFLDSMDFFELIDMVKFAHIHNIPHMDSECYYATKNKITTEMRRGKCMTGYTGLLSIITHSKYYKGNNNGSNR